MPSHAGPNIVGESNIVFSYDTGDTSNSYRGEPTTNIAANLGLVPVAIDSTTYVGMENGWAKYSLSGTWNSGTYPYAIALTPVTFTGGLPYCVRATVKTNVMNKFNYFGANGISYVNEPKNYEGTLTSTLNPDGSYTVTRYNFAYTNTTAQAGYLYTNPVNGAVFNPSTDFVWVKEYQAEQKDHPTQFVNGTRSATQGLLPLISNASLDISTVSFDSNAQMTFDGTDDFIESTTNLTPLQDLTSGTAELIFKWNGSTSFTVLLHLFAGSSYYGTTIGLGNWTGTYSDESIIFMVSNASGTALTNETYYRNGTFTYRDGLYHHLVVTTNGSTVQIYLDGNQLSLTSTASSKFSPPTITKLQLGKRDFNSGTGFHSGEIPIVKIYNTALTTNQVKQNYQQYKTRFNLS